MLEEREKDQSEIDTLGFACYSLSFPTHKLEALSDLSSVRPDFSKVKDAHINIMYVSFT